MAEGGSSAYKSILRKVLEQGYRGTLDFRHKDSKRIELDLAITAVRDYQTQTAKLVCTGRGITQECELQAELSAVRRMETVGTLAEGVAHDFKNLLMVISKYAKLGLQTLYCEHPLRRNLEAILAASQRAAGLTRQLLVSGRTQVPGPQFVNLNSVVEQACRMAAASVGGGN